MEDNKEKVVKIIMEHYIKRMNKLRQIKINNLQELQKKNEKTLLEDIRNKIKNNYGKNR